MPTPVQARLLRAWCAAREDESLVPALERRLLGLPEAQPLQPPDQLGIAGRPLPSWPVAVRAADVTLGGKPVLTPGGEAAGRAKLKKLVRRGQLVARSAVEGDPGARVWVQPAHRARLEVACDGAELVSLPPTEADLAAETNRRQRWVAWTAWRALRFGGWCSLTEVAERARLLQQDHRRGQPPGAPRGDALAEEQVPLEEQLRLVLTQLADASATTDAAALATVLGPLAWTEGGPADARQGVVFQKERVGRVAAHWPDPPAFESSAAELLAAESVEGWLQWLKQDRRDGRGL